MCMTEEQILERLQLAQRAALNQAWKQVQTLLEPIREHPGALHLSGLICLEQKHYAEAFQLLETALLRGAPFSLHAFLAQNYFEMSRFADAARHYQHIFQRDFRLTDADLHRYALSLHEMGNFAMALNLYQQLLVNYPKHALLQMHLGNVYTELGQIQAALQALGQAHQLEPDNVQIRYNFARVLLASGQIEAAQDHLEWLLKSCDDYVPAYLLQARLFELGGDPQKALEACAQAVQIDPQHGPAWHNLGLCQLNLYRGAEAEAAFRKAQALMPGDALVMQHLARLLRNLCKPHEAQKHLQTLSQQDPRSRYQEAFVLPPVYRSEAELSFWQEHFQAALNSLELTAPELKDPLREVPVLPFYLAYTGLAERPLMEQLAQVFLSACPMLGSVPARAQPMAKPMGQKLRLGIVSSAFREHTVFQLFGHLFRTLDHKRIEIIALAIGVLDPTIDQYLARYTQARICLPEDLSLAKRAILDSELDVLLYLDIGMSPMTWYLSLSRLAPLQYLTWGHGITTGSSAFEGFLSSSGLETERGQENYSEPLICLPTLLGQWQLPEGFTVSPLSDLDLPQGRRYLCPQSLYKFHPEFDSYLSGILEQDIQGHLILVKGLYPEWEDVLRQRWKDVLDLDRVHFLPRLSAENYLNLLAQGDVMLDSWPFGGGLTLMQALSLGVPIVTRTGQHLKNRLGTAICQQIKCLDGVVDSESAYIACAVQLAMQGKSAKIANQYAQHMSQERAGQALSELLLGHI